jgi:hypothetical protein
LELLFVSKIKENSPKKKTFRRQKKSSSVATLCHNKTKRVTKWVQRRGNEPAASELAGSTHVYNTDQEGSIIATTASFVKQVGTIQTL